MRFNPLRRGFDPIQSKPSEHNGNKHFVPASSRFLFILHFRCTASFCVLEEIEIAPLTRAAGVYFRRFFVGKCGVVVVLKLRAH